MLIDLHTHSTASDGQYAPAELVKMAKERALVMYALTDHDTVGGIGEAAAAAKELHVHFIPGIEISSWAGGEEIHIVGLSIDADEPVLAGKCREFTESRDNRGEVICQYLNGIGISVTMEEIRAIAGEANIARPHFAAWLQEHGYVAERKEAFRRYLDTEAFHEATDRKLPSAEESIGLIHGAGGKAVLAHPGLMKMPVEEQKKLVAGLKDAGLDAIECCYFKHKPQQEKLYFDWASECGLNISCGSDFHGEKVKPDVPFGMTLREEWVPHLIIC